MCIPSALSLQVSGTFRGEKSNNFWVSVYSDLYKSSTFPSVGAEIFIFTSHSGIKPAQLIAPRVPPPLLQTLACGCEGVGVGIDTSHSHSYSLSESVFFKRCLCFWITVSLGEWKAEKRNNRHIWQPLIYNQLIAQEGEKRSVARRRQWGRRKKKTLKITIIPHLFFRKRGLFYLSLSVSVFFFLISTESERRFGVIKWIRALQNCRLAWETLLHGFLPNYKGVAEQK